MEQMDKVKKNFGFGCMRLPMNGDQVDIAETTRMVDEFLAQGFNYFDTAHGYIGGKSELALKECLTSRYPREAYSPDRQADRQLFQDRGGHPSRFLKASWKPAAWTTLIFT